jgi:hypothetical protein
MGHGKFTNGYLPATGDVTVTGPFNPDDDEVKVARIIFLIVQGMRRGSPLDTVVVKGEGEWHRTQPGYTKTEWRGTCPRSGDPDLGPSNSELQVSPDADTRGIALSIVIQPGHVLQDSQVLPRDEEPKPGAALTFDPPSIEALNWCADVEMVSGPPPSPGTTA